MESGKYRVRLFIAGGCALVAGAVMAGEGAKAGMCHCAKRENTYEYRTLAWNPPFAEARLKTTLDTLAQAGQDGFRIAKSLPDGTGGELLVLERRRTRCAEGR